MFLHAADIHRDSPPRGLNRYEGAPAAEIRAATRRALENLVEVALDERVDFVVLAGDLYDGASLSATGRNGQISARVRR